MLGNIAAMELQKYLIFVCSGAAKGGEKKLSHRVATTLVARGCADLGTAQNLSEQTETKRMLFINDCRAGCVNALMKGLDKARYLYLDLSAHTGNDTFDVDQFIDSELMPTLQAQWC